MKKVAVLMSTYNGEEYIETQIESILHQVGVEVAILVRDDGSSDKTVSILEKYKKNGELNWYSGCNLKPAKSFMDLIRNAPDADYYAFADQDDYWKPQKLLRAVDKLENYNKEDPALYYSDTILVDRNLKPLNIKKINLGPFMTMGQAVISSNATGCTMCFIKALQKIIKKYEPRHQIMHDGWIHKVCVSLNGNLYYDKKSYILYRQHSNNVVGGTSSFKKRWKARLNNLVHPTCERSKGIQELIKGYATNMPESNLKICKQVAQYKDNYINRFSVVDFLK